jgi:hypothetical protein
MPFAKEIAAELRKIADALDLNPEVETIKPTLSFFFFYAEEKEKFMATARLLPRPVQKQYPEDDDHFSRVRVVHSADAVDVETSIYRTAICTIVKPAQPAEYDCSLTLLDHEDASLTA